MKTVFKKINQWNNGKNAIYHCSLDGYTQPFEVEKKKDRIGELYIVECSLTGRFECYGMTAVKNRIESDLISAITNQYPD